MKSKEFKNFVLLEDEKDDVREFASFLEYIVPKEFSENNIVVDLLKYNKMTLEELLEFLKISNKHRRNKKSFVLICKVVDPDVIPFELIVVPTLQEAEDIVDLEEIERDMGF